jgi:hypothetical protein
MDQDTAQPTTPLSAGMTSLGSGPLAQLLQMQMDKIGPELESAKGERQSALKQYQDAIRAAPDKLTGRDESNAIGEGYYASPSWAWNPIDALSRGFARANEISDARRNMRINAEQLVPLAGYEDKKDTYDKLLGKQMTLTGAANLAGRELSQMGMTAREITNWHIKIAEIALKQAYETKAPDPENTAFEIANSMLKNMGIPGVTPEVFKTLLPSVVPRQVPSGTNVTGDQPQPGMPPPVLPSAGTPPAAAAPAVGGNPPPGSGMPPTPGIVDTPAKMKAEIERAATNADLIGAQLLEMKKKPQSPAQQVAIKQLEEELDKEQETANTLTEQYRAATGQAVVPGAPAAAVKSVGETNARAAGRARQMKQEEGFGSAVPQQAAEGLKYRNELAQQASDAIEVKRSVGEINKALDEFSNAGKLAKPRTLIAQYKVALAQAWGEAPDPKDVKDAALGEDVSKLTFDMAVRAVKSISSRPAQMEFLKGLENVPNIDMTPEGRKAIVGFIMRRANDSIDKLEHFMQWSSKNGYTMNMPEHQARFPEHDLEWIPEQNRRVESRQRPREPVDVNFGGNAVKVTPKWDEEQKGFVANFPDGTVRPLKGYK